MRKNLTSTVVFLAGAIASTLTLSAQQATLASHRGLFAQTDVAVLFNLEHAQVARTDTPTFWLKGGSVDASTSLWKGLGIAANLTGEHTENIQSNVSLGKFAYMFGPRYTFDASRYTGGVTKNRGTQVFGEVLFGGVHAFDSTFPGTNTVKTSASSFSMQTGGGIDVHVAKGLGIRALEMDWVHTTLPNNAANSQNDLRIAFGVSWKWKH